jgi:hypothetical protein
MGYDMSVRHHVYVKSLPDTDIDRTYIFEAEKSLSDVMVVSFSADEVVLKKKLYCYCRSTLF